MASDTAKSGKRSENLDVPEIWDVIVIGAGVVGCAITRKFALAGARTLLLERGRDILSGASKANSAILHTGFDAPPRQPGSRLHASRIS